MGTGGGGGETGGGGGRETRGPGGGGKDRVVKEDREGGCRGVPSRASKTSHQHIGR